MSKAQVVSELWQFMKENKKYWLAPIVITLVLFGVLLVLAKSFSHRAHSSILFLSCVTPSPLGEGGVEGLRHVFGVTWTFIPNPFTAVRENFAVLIRID